MIRTIDVGGASRPKPGETACGDQYLVLWDDHRVLIAVVDGLGHGPRAEEAAKIVCRYVTMHRGESLSEIIYGSHEIMRSERGVVMTLCRIDSDSHSLCHAGVGNVELTSVSNERIAAIPVPGIVGSGRFRVRESQHQLHSGDAIVVFTDGVSSRFDLESYEKMSAADMAQSILSDWAKDHDDATCVVCIC